MMDIALHGAYQSAVKIIGQQNREEYPSVSFAFRFIFPIHEEYAVFRCLIY